MTVNGINILFNASEAGAPLPVGDDGSVQLFLPFTFKLCGQSFDSVFVNANGSITFGAPSRDFSESRFEFLDGPPRAAGLWDDLNPGRRRDRDLRPDRPHLHGLLDGRAGVPAAGSNTFSIKLYRLFDRIDVTYGGMTAVDGLAGVSCGGNVTSRYEQQQDLSRFPIVELISDPAGFEIFSPPRPFDLANSHAALHRHAELQRPLGRRQQYAGDREAGEPAVHLERACSSSPSTRRPTTLTSSSSRRKPGRS